MAILIDFFMNHSEWNLNMLEDLCTFSFTVSSRRCVFRNRALQFLRETVKLSPLNLFFQSRVVSGEKNVQDQEIILSSWPPDIAPGAMHYSVGVL